MRRDIVKQFRTHNTMGVVISLVLPVDREVKLILFELNGGGQQGLSNYTQLMGLLRGGQPACITDRCQGWYC